MERCGHIVETPNRTILELKYLSINTIKKYMKLPIAPYWNWNCFSKCSTNNAVPPNRTILELKSKIIAHIFIPSVSQSHHTGIEMDVYWSGKDAGKSPNRTILELKWLLSQQIAQTSFLPIAPYWNWNAYEQGGGCCYATPNRTILELKSGRYPSFLCFLSTPNRTILELKCSQL